MVMMNEQQHHQQHQQQHGMQTQQQQHVMGSGAFSQPPPPVVFRSGPPSQQPMFYPVSPPAMYGPGGQPMFPFPTQGFMPQPFYPGPFQSGRGPQLGVGGGGPIPNRGGGNGPPFPGASSSSGATSGVATGTQQPPTAPAPPPQKRERKPLLILDPKTNEEVKIPPKETPPPPPPPPPVAPPSAPTSASPLLQSTISPSPVTIQQQQQPGGVAVDKPSGSAAGQEMVAKALAAVGGQARKRNAANLGTSPSLGPVSASPSHTSVVTMPDLTAEMSNLKLSGPNLPAADVVMVAAAKAAEPPPPHKAPPSSSYIAKVLSQTPPETPPSTPVMINSKQPDVITIAPTTNGGGSLAAGGGGGAHAHKLATAAITASKPSISRTPPMSTTTTISQPPTSSSSSMHVGITTAQQPPTKPSFLAAATSSKTAEDRRLKEEEARRKVEELKRAAESKQEEQAKRKAEEEEEARRKADASKRKDDDKPRDYDAAALKSLNAPPPFAPVQHPIAPPLSSTSSSAPQQQQMPSISPSPPSQLGQTSTRGSSSATDGKIMYTRDELNMMRNLEASLLVPEELEGEDFLVLISGRRTVPSSSANSSRLGGGGGGAGGNNKLPVVSIGPPRALPPGQTLPGSDWRMQTGRGGMPMIALPLNSQPLKRSSNAWQPSLKVTDEHEATMRQIKGILNKISPDNAERLCKKVLAIPMTSLSMLKDVITTIFDKALAEPHFGAVYAQLCKQVAEQSAGEWSFVSIVEKEDGFWWTSSLDQSEDNYMIGPEPTYEAAKAAAKKSTDFKRLLLSKCQEEFEKESFKVVEDKEAQVMERQKIEGNTPEIQKTLLELAEERRSTKKRVLGNIAFIGELFLKKMISQKIIHTCVLTLCPEGGIQDPESYFAPGGQFSIKPMPADDVEALCKLFATVGKDFDVGDNVHWMHKYFAFLERLSEQKILEARYRFMVVDLIELRHRNWQERMDKLRVMTKEEIRESVLRDEEAELRRNAQGNRGGGQMAQNSMSSSAGSNVRGGVVGNRGTTGGASSSTGGGSGGGARTGMMAPVSFEAKMSSSMRSPRGVGTKIPPTAVVSRTPVLAASSSSSVPPPPRAVKDVAPPPLPMVVPSATPSPGPAVDDGITGEPIESKTDLKKKFRGALDEMSAVSHDELLEELDALTKRYVSGPDVGRRMLVDFILERVVEGKDEEREALTNLVADLVVIPPTSNVFSLSLMNDVVPSAAAQLEFISDIKVDAPKADQHLSVFLARAILLPCEPTVRQQVQDALLAPLKATGDGTQYDALLALLSSKLTTAIQVDDVPSVLKAAKNDDEVLEWLQRKTIPSVKLAIDVVATIFRDTTRFPPSSYARVLQRVLASDDTMFHAQVLDGLAAMSDSATWFKAACMFLYDNSIIVESSLIKWRDTTKHGEAVSGVDEWLTSLAKAKVKDYSDSDS